MVTRQSWGILQENIFGLILTCRRQRAFQNPFQSFPEQANCIEATQQLVWSDWSAHIPWMLRRLEMHSSWMFPSSVLFHSW